MIYIAVFRALLDNYEIETGIAEKVTDNEIREGNEFLDAILDTEVFRILHRFLIDHNLAPSDRGSLKENLYRIWFQFYRRSK